MRATHTTYVTKSVFTFAILMVCVAGLRAQSVAGPGEATLPPGDAKEIVAKACNQCHGLAMIVTLRDGRVGWLELVDNMILRGAQVRPEEAKLTVDYLFDNFGLSKGPMTSPKGAVLILPEGAGRTEIESHCMLCHDAGRITGEHRTKAEWEATVGKMMHWGNISVTPDEIQTMTAYLNTQFGKKAD
jgi:cytochrome c5